MHARVRSAASCLGGKEQDLEFTIALMGEFNHNSIPLYRISKCRSQSWVEVVSDSHRIHYELLERRE